LVDKRQKSGARKNLSEEEESSDNFAGILEFFRITLDLDSFFFVLGA
jgi:hypothetical protein